MRMHDRKPLLTLSLVVLLSLLGAAATTAAPPMASQAAPQAAPPLAITPPATTPGIYMAFTDWFPEDPARYSHQGEFVVFNWDYLQADDGELVASRIRGFLERRAAQGLKAAFGISAYAGRGGGGIKLPKYLRDNPEAVVDVGDGWLIPRYWSPVYLEAYNRLVSQIAVRFRGDPRLEFIAIGTGRYGETQACDDQDDAAMMAAGLNSDVWIDAVEQMTDSWLHWFDPDGNGLQTGLSQQVAGYTFNARERREISWYSAQRGIGLSINGLYPQQAGAVMSGGSCPSCGMYDGILAFWEMVPIAFETYHYMLCDTQEVYWGMISGLDKHADYLRLQKDLFFELNPDGSKGPDRPENLEIFEWVSPYLGATVNDTPSVWVALRAPRFPYRTCWQDAGSTVYETGIEPGNFSFWLDQDDTIPGGKTVPEANTCCDRSGIPLEYIGDNTDPYNPNLPSGREGWVIRRTDQATGNPYMWLKIDDGYIHGGWNTV
ncbi:MAG: hypothetical protein H8E47_14375, partial [Anaerolineales bacterium]|nr:hypothetical protein [Anaerolineales bacterium]